MLQKGNRFCPFCFEDQLAPVDIDAAGDPPPPAAPGRGLSVAKEVPAPMVIDFRDTVQPEADEVIHIPGPTGSPALEADAEIGMVRPGAFWQTEVLGGGKRNRLARFATPQRMVAGIALALVVAGLAVVGFERVYVDGENEAGRARAFRDDVERVRRAGSVLPQDDNSVPARRGGAVAFQHERVIPSGRERVIPARGVGVQVGREPQGPGHADQRGERLPRRMPRSSLSAPHWTSPSARESDELCQ